MSGSHALAPTSPLMAPLTSAFKLPLTSSWVGASSSQEASGLRESTKLGSSFDPTMILKERLTSLPKLLILTIRPVFEVDIRAIITPSTNLDASIGLGYKSPGRDLFFPPRQDRDQQVPVEKKQTPLRVAVAKGGAGQIEAHVIPKVTLGISALGGLAEAFVYWDVDGSSSLSVTPSWSETCVDLKAAVRLELGAVGNLPGIGNDGNGTYVQINNELARWDWDLYQDCIADQNHLGDGPMVPVSAQIVLGGGDLFGQENAPTLDSDGISGQLQCLPAGTLGPQEVLDRILNGTN
ncbi:hypothetical protein OE88DRAFT_600240 [Heliocybe sulcata]|uniref:Uncharacterized protein n=1 Tax=Heliocybe sulcata TaxID=5364 RepID=A0A5C3MT34_9AGAM|nr:hypothetical protein OE88DRAFT_600240 [Heliocybe sulcata]